MQNRFSRVLLAVVLCLTTGCSAMSQHQGITSFGQPKIQTTEQWNVLANNLANRINNELIRLHYLSSSVAVRRSCDASNSCRAGEISPFDEVFHDLLATQLTSFGVNILKAPEGAALLVDYKVQLLYNGNHEVILTTSIIDKGKFVMRFTDTFSIDSEAYWKYQQPSPASEIELTDRDGARPPSKLKTSSL
jgi:hypothetical protein